MWSCGRERANRLRWRRIDKPGSHSLRLTHPCTASLLLDKETIIDKTFGAQGLPGTVEFGDGISLRVADEERAETAAAG